MCDYMQATNIGKEDVLGVLFLSCQHWGCGRVPRYSNLPARSFKRDVLMALRAHAEVLV